VRLFLRTYIHGGLPRLPPGTQNRSVGRQLMQAVIARASERRFAGVRLVQAAYHNRSLSLYAKPGLRDARAARLHAGDTDSEDTAGL
jgi:GNAT superfamily N-acetyltransferase